MPICYQFHYLSPVRSEGTKNFFLSKSAILELATFSTITCTVWVTCGITTICYVLTGILSGCFSLTASASAFLTSITRTRSPLRPTNIHIFHTKWFFFLVLPLHLPVVKPFLLMQNKTLYALVTRPMTS